MRHGRAFWLFVGPFAVGLLVFVYVPIGWSLLLSFFDARNTVTPTDRSSGCATTPTC